MFSKGYKKQIEHYDRIMCVIVPRYKKALKRVIELEEKNEYLNKRIADLECSIYNQGESAWERAVVLEEKLKKIGDDIQELIDKYGANQ